jgi:hypothetical protein
LFCSIILFGMWMAQGHLEANNKSKKDKKKRLRAKMKKQENLAGLAWNIEQCEGARVAANNLA